MSGPIDGRGNVHDANGRFINLDKFIEERDRRYEERFASERERRGALESRIQVLESGGAPFASRLDESLCTLKEDVEHLKEDAIRGETLASLRADAERDRVMQGRSIRIALIAAGASFAFSIILLIIETTVTWGG